MWVAARSNCSDVNPCSCPVLDLASLVLVLVLVLVGLVLVLVLACPVLVNITVELQSNA